MEYTIQKLSRMAGVSTRTLRYYDEIGLLKPARTTESGYRIYGPAEVDRLQQIMFYRELGVSLDKIGQILADPRFDTLAALKEHRRQLLEQKNRLDLLIRNVERTIRAHERRIPLPDDLKFEGFKRQLLIEENERKYGKEARAKYGDEAVNRSNEKLMNMTREQHEELTRLERELKSVLAEAIKTKDPAGPLAQKAAELHKKWLMFFWDNYSKEAHAGLAQMYVDDERFRAYYDAEQPGTAAFLRDAIRIYTGVQLT